MGIREISVDVNSDELEATEIEDNSNKFSVSNSHDKEWRNVALVPQTLPIKCRIPHNVLIMMRTIEKQVESKLKRGKLEFGAFLKGKYESGVLTIEDDLLILKQKVTGASIDWQEAPPAEYNGVIHRHPSGCTSFSGTDANLINQNQDFSLLYVNNEITMGIFNVKLFDNSRLQLPLSIEIMYPVFSGNLDELVNKIEVNEPPVHPLSITNRLIDDGQGRLQFPDYSPGCNFSGERNPLFDELPDDENNEDDEDLEDCFECPYCGYYQKIEMWPFKCESCDNLLEECECSELNDLSEDERDQSQVARLKFSKLGESLQHG